MSSRVGPGRTAQPLPKARAAAKPKVQAKAHQSAPKRDVEKAKKTVAAVHVAGHTPLPSVSLGSLEVDCNVEKQPIRTWKIENGKAREVALTATTAKLPPATRYAALSEDQLSDALKDAHAKRSEELSAGGVRTMPMAMPEDGSVKVRAYHLAVLGEDATRSAYPLAMAQVGRAEGFRTVIRVGADRAAELQKEVDAQGLTDFVTLIPVTLRDPIETTLDFWSEDQGELHVDGSISVPRSLSKGDGVGDVEAYHALLTDRLQRLHPDVKIDAKTDDDFDKLLKKYPTEAFAGVGVVSSREGQRAIAALAVGAGKSVHVTNGYLEGGNTLIGRRADGTGYAIVGKDSLAVSRAALEKDLGRRLRDEELHAFIAADYGVAQVIPVEQPGGFHIDMDMMLLPGGHVVLNDAMEAFSLMKQWRQADQLASKPVDPGPHATQLQRDEYQFLLDSWQSREKKWLPQAFERLEKASKTKAAFEAKVADDLKRAGLTVHRMAGVFMSDNGEPMNFLNGEAARRADGKGFYIALGGDLRAEKYVVQKLGQELPSGFSNIHFLDRKWTGYTLNADGGLSCRAKLEGDLA